MALPGLLIEYLIVGSLAFAWLYPILKRAGLDSITPSNLPLIVLGLYVVGMMIDFYAFILLRPIKQLVRARADKRYRLTNTSGWGRTAARAAKFSLHAPEIAKEVQMRSSRDRIARGAFINAVLATVLGRELISLWAGLFLIVTSFLMWMVFEFLSYSYEVKAEQALEEKIAAERHKAGG